MTAERGPAYRQWLARRTVAVVGLARSGVAAARLIRRLGGRVLASDSGPRRRSPREYPTRSARLRALRGRSPRGGVRGRRVGRREPRGPLELPALEAARARGVPIIGELELGWRVMAADLIAITGTNGKTTTTALTGDLAAGTMRPVLVGGNIGTPLSAQALDFPPTAWSWPKRPPSSSTRPSGCGRGSRWFSTSALIISTATGPSSATSTPRRRSSPIRSRRTARY